METAKIQPNNLMRYKSIFNLKSRVASVLGLIGLISKKEAKKMLEVSKKSRMSWR